MSRTPQHGLILLSERIRGAKGFAPIILLFLVVVVGALVVGGAYLYGKGSLKLPTQKQPASSSAQVSATPAPTNDETANWKTYTTSTYSIKYPSDLELKEGEASTVQLFKLGSTQQVGTELYDGIWLRFQPVEISNAKAINYAKTIIEKTTRAETGEVIEDPKPITVNTYQGIAFTTRGLGDHKQIILEGQNSMLMHITNSTVDPNKQDYQKTVDKILSTFKFTQ